MHFENMILERQFSFYAYYRKVSSSKGLKTQSVILLGEPAPRNSFFLSAMTKFKRIVRLQPCSLMLVGCLHSYFQLLLTEELHKRLRKHGSKVKENATKSEQSQMLFFFFSPCFEKLFLFPSNSQDTSQPLPIEWKI